ncbi:hypothetical protein LSUE1_G001817 [Lachnellula suecica]|uniref:Uncharacterized protein n=1 Tax=Lachnellula suecica TaxID=602035 RepID=A0A8T9CF71_9HELO|nr:hypothetical protein LSUE1_G001817 [Lachnellula suecica]
MSDTWNLLKSHGGIPLAPEVCLRVVEYAIDDEPKVAAVLMGLSKSFCLLLRSYETSLAKALSKNDDRLEHVNAAQPIALSSRLPPGDATVTTLTYEWYLEMRCRASLIDFLVQHEITDMDDDTNGWPTIENIHKSELLLRQTVFKKRAFGLLYQLADCTAGIKNSTPDRDQRIRAEQGRLLESLSETDLSALGCLVEIVGQGFFTIFKNKLLASSRLGQSLPYIAHSQSSVLVPSATQLNDLSQNNDNWIRECMCVFEDRVQRYGPYFAWSFVAGANNRARRPDLWVNDEIQQGLDDMNSFEMGHTMAYASLQSVVWRVFCRKNGCTLQDSWNEAKTLVESEMAEYKL